MSADRFFLQHRVRDLDESPAYQPISRVRIHAGEDGDGNPIVYEAGNTTGRTIDVDNPLIMDDASGRTIAANVLAAIQGYAYKPYQAGNAILDPAAEIGDAVSIDEVYSVLADIETTFSPLMTANIGAREDGSIDHEYPFESSTDREITRSIADLKTSFIVENGRIAAEISSVTETAEGQSKKITSIETTVNGIHAYTESEIQTLAEGEVKSWAEKNFTPDGIETIVGNKFDAAGAAATALQDAKQYTDGEIAPIAGEYQSAINQKANEITATVAAQESKWDTSQLPSGVSISAYGYGIPSNTTAAQYRNKYYLDQSSGRYYKSNGTSWVRQTQQLELITSNLKSAIKINADSITSVVSDMRETQNAVSSIDQRIDSITMSVSSVNGFTTLTLKDDEMTLDTKTFQATVNSFNVIGDITATSVAANSFIQAPAISGGTIAGSVVSGGTIVGGSFMDDGQAAQMTLTSYGGYPGGGVLYYGPASQPQGSYYAYFQVTGIGNTANPTVYVTLGGTTVGYISGGIFYAQGAWNFSGASVSGLPE